jgi:Cdc6-like AAA superfamily ATPase
LLTHTSNLSQAIKDDTKSDHTRTSREDRDSARHRWLSEWVSASDYPAQQSDIVNRREEGTGQWFLDTPEVVRWFNEAKATLFCPGIPGAGKTTIAAIVIDYLLNTAQSSSHGVAYVYCNYKLQEKQDASSMLAAVLKQLVQGRKSTVEQVEQLYQKHADRGTKPSLDEITSVIEDVLTHYPSVYIVIDALDECQFATRQQVLTKLQDLKARRNIHLMVTARFTPDIEAALREALRLEIRASREDIKCFVIGQTYRLPACIQRSLVLQEMVQERIADAADGM